MASKTELLNRLSKATHSLIGGASKGSLKLMRWASGTAKAEKNITKLSRQTINKKYQDTMFNRMFRKDKIGKYTGKQVSLKEAEAIREARKAMKAASKAELKWMQAHPELGTKLKSGNLEFGGAANRAALAKVRSKALKPFIKSDLKKIRKNRAMLGLLGAAVGLPTAYALTTSTGMTNAALDLIGNNTRLPDGTPLFTINRDWEDQPSHVQAFLQEAVDRKQIPGKWSTPEERDAYFLAHPNDTIRTGWIGRLSHLRDKGVNESDYKRYFGTDYGGLSSMPAATGFGFQTGSGLSDVDAGKYTTMQSMGSFPMAFVKDGVLTDGETWDYKESDKTAPYPANSIPGALRVFAGRHGTNETDNVQPIVTSNMKIPYKRR